MSKSLKETSKFLSYVLRHGDHAEIMFERGGGNSVIFRCSITSLVMGDS